MKRLIVVLFAAAAAIVGGAVVGDESGESELSKVMCPVSNKPVKESATADYRDATVYFCCPNCPKAFTKKPSKYAAKANLQLVQTKQFHQVACPISGQPVDSDITSKVGQLDVGMCCENCQGKVDKAEEDDKLALVFSDKAFEKGFEATVADE